MTTSKKKGNEAEKLAVKYLEARGFEILESNYRSGRNEVDIICKIQEILVFVEVKYRKNQVFGYPEEFVDSNQLSRIMETAENYITDNEWKGEVRFDIIALLGEEIQHFEDIDPGV